MIEQRAHISERADGLRQAFDLSFVEARRLETKETEDLLAVEIGGDPYMLRLAEIAGFLSDKKVTRLPSSAPELSGVGGFRGAIMPVYDLAALLKYPPSRTTRWMVIAAAAPVALAFDEFDGHHRFAADEIVVRDGSDEDELLSHVVHAGQFVRPIVNISSIVAAIQHHAAAVGAAQEH